MKTLRVRCLGAIRRRLTRFGANRSGNVAIVFALSAVVLMLGIGAAVDIGRWLHARDKTLSAIDAAVLAGARALQLDDADVDVAVAQAQKFYDENVTKRLPVTDDTVTFGVADDGQSVTASGSAYIKTPFLQFANIDKLPLINTATAEFSSAGYGTSEDLEIALMLDVTGSMKGDKLADLKVAAKDLIEIIETQSGSGYTTKMALVPFSEDIRLPTTAATNKARGNNLPDEKTVGSRWNSKTYYLSDCIVERTGSQKYTDAAPGSGQYAQGHYTEDYTQSGNGGGNGWGWGGGWGSGGKKTGKCTIPENSAIVPLSDDTEMLKGKVDDLSASGGTAGHLGTAWSWYTLSPNWNTLWPAKSRAADYGTPHLQKIAILMTDGEYNTQYDSDGITASEHGAANGSSTEQARALCSSMKSAGIIVYSIGFELSGPSSQSYKTLKQCATDETKFYDAENGDQLQQAFRDIGLKLSKLYLSK
jgi:Flp pilus assembly protein TadG